MLWARRAFIVTDSFLYKAVIQSQSQINDELGIVNTTFFNVAPDRPSLALKRLGTDESI